VRLRGGPIANTINWRAGFALYILLSAMVLVLRSHD